MNLAATSYVIYLLVMAAVTLGVGARLHHHGKPFLMDVFAGQTAAATTTNGLLLAGYYLTNFAMVLLLLRVCEPVENVTQAVNFVSGRVGIVLVLLGAMHMGNIVVLTGVRRWIVRRRVFRMHRDALLSPRRCP